MTFENDFCLLTGNYELKDDVQMHLLRIRISEEILRMGFQYVGAQYSLTSVDHGFTKGPEGSIGYMTIRLEERLVPNTVLLEFSNILGVRIAHSLKGTSWQESEKKCCELEQRLDAIEKDIG